MTASGATEARDSSYFRYIRAAHNRPDYYPLDHRPDPALYRPAATWLGRLILPRRDERRMVMGALMEVQLADPTHAHLAGQTVRVRWYDDPATNARYWGVTRQVLFSEGGRELAATGRVVPERLDNWPHVNPFESLAGILPHDDMIVRLPAGVRVEEQPCDGGAPILWLPSDPIQTTGRYYALVRFLGPDSGDCYRVVHYNRATAAFDGPEEVVRLPEVVQAADGIYNSVSDGIERSPAGDDGWYIYGAQDAAGVFVVQAYAPHSMFRLKPQRVIAGQRAGREYLKPGAWQASDDKGTYTSGLIIPDGVTPEQALSAWEVGQKALLIHIYGLIGGPEGEAFARSPLNWGHFSYGVATVVHEPLADEPMLDLVYNQVYVASMDGIIPGTQHWTRYSGDRQFGFVGVRPIQDILIKQDSFTEPFDFDGVSRSALDTMVMEIETMTARYRIADGHGGSRVTSAHNCSQDSNQALYAAIRNIDRLLNTRADLQDWRRRNPAEDARIQQLLAIGEDLRREMLPLGAARADWEYGTPLIGSGLSEHPVRSLGMTLKTWKTLLPSVAARVIAGVFLRHGAQAWVLRTNQVGGHDPRIEPYVPNV
jgi:predicted Abi (CAAX) family protease